MEVLVCLFDVHPCYEGPSSSPCHFLSDVLYRDIVEGTGVSANTVVDTMAVRPRQIENEVPHAGLVALWNDSKAAGLQARHWQDMQAIAAWVPCILCRRVCTCIAYSKSMPP